MSTSEWLIQLAALDELPYLVAFAVGLLAAIGPCPLATNVSAMAYIAQQFARRRDVLVSGAFYAIGRSLAYGLIGSLVLAANAQIGPLASRLQDLADVALGPLLVLVGLILLDVFQPAGPIRGASLEELRQRLARSRQVGSFGLGFVFALAFCPYSAALFFLFLIPLAMRSVSGLGLPFVFGVGTALPVLVLGVPLSLGLEKAAARVQRVGQIEAVARRVAGLVFIAAGAYSILRFFQTWRGGG